MSRSSEAMATGSATLRQLDGYMEAQEKTKSFDVGLAMTNTLVNSLITAGEITTTNGAVAAVRETLPQLRQFLEEQLRTIRAELGEKVTTPEVVPSLPAGLA